jgi:hypothetical protein
MNGVLSCDWGCGYVTPETEGKDSLQAFSKDWVSDYLATVTRGSVAISRKQCGLYSTGDQYPHSLVTYYGQKLTNRRKGPHIYRFHICMKTNEGGHTVA